MTTTIPNPVIAGWLTYAKLNGQLIQVQQGQSIPEGAVEMTRRQWFNEYMDARQQQPTEDDRGSGRTQPQPTPYRTVRAIEANASAEQAALAADVQGLMKQMDETDEFRAQARQRAGIKSNDDRGSGRIPLTTKLTKRSNPYWVTGPNDYEVIVLDCTGKQDAIQKALLGHLSPRLCAATPLRQDYHQYLEQESFSLPHDPDVAWKRSGQGDKFVRQVKQAPKRIRSIERAAARLAA